VTVIKLWQYLHFARFFEGRASVITMITTTYNPIADTVAYWRMVIKRSHGGPLYSQGQILSVPNGVYNYHTSQGYNRVILDSAICLLTAFNSLWTSAHVAAMIRTRFKSSVRRPHPYRLRSISLLVETCNLQWFALKEHLGCVTARRLGTATRNTWLSCKAAIVPSLLHPMASKSCRVVQ
jgi:hypothetical protein